MSKAQGMRPAPVMAAVSLAFACGHSGHATGVFLPVGTLAPASQTAQATAGEVRQSHLVRIAHNELQRARAEVDSFGHSHLLFNMSERVQLAVAVQRTTRTLDGYTLSGHIDGGKGGFVTLAAHGRAVAGSIWTWGTNYEIVPVGGGVHAVRQVPDEAVECSGEVGTSSVQPTPPARTIGAVDEIAVVDVLAFWTPALEVARGGEHHAKLVIDLAIAYTNDVLERSGAFVSLNLVGAELLDVQEINVAQLFDVLRGAYVTERADALGADNIAMFHSGRFPGQYSAANSTTTPPNTKLSVNAPSARTFSHEIGHNLGVFHDRGARIAPSYAYDGGYVAIARRFAGTDCHITTMAYGVRCQDAGLESKRIPYYSNPNRYHPLTGTPLGVSRLGGIRDWNGPSDAVLEINRNRHRASNVRPRRSKP